LKFKTYTYNPVFGIATIAAFVLISLPFLYEIKVSKLIFLIIGAILIVFDMIICINQFKKNLVINSNGEIKLEVNFGINKFLEFKKPYKLIKFWGYNSYKFPFRVWNYSGKSPGYKRPVRIITCLNIFLKDKNGKEIIFYENMLPWLDVPNDWDYHVLSSDSRPTVKVFNVRKILKELEKYGTQ
jgi:hypothetical protein